MPVSMLVSLANTSGSMSLGTRNCTVLISLPPHEETWQCICITEYICL